MLMGMKCTLMPVYRCIIFFHNYVRSRVVRFDSYAQFLQPLWEEWVTDKASTFFLCVVNINYLYQSVKEARRHKTDFK